MNRYLSIACLMGMSIVPFTSAQETKQGKEKFPFVSVTGFELPDELEVKVWAKSPMFFNPTNMDVDYKGRIWVNEGRTYRVYRNKFNKNKVRKGDRIMVLSDTDKDGVADKSHVFVQDPQLVAPLGIAIIGNKIVVSQPPSILVYHDINGDAIFDPTVDKKEEFLTGFGGQDHDHSLHAVKTGPNGQWYFNSGNAGTHMVKDKEGFTIRVGSSYKAGSPSVTKNGPLQGGKPGLKSDDGHVYTGSVALRVNADGTGLRVIGHNMRNSYEEAVTSFGDVFQNDNDDPPACRTTWLMEYANMGFSSDDGRRTWIRDRRPGQKMSDAHWRQDDPGKIPAGDVYGNGSPTGIAFYENGGLGGKFNGLLLSGEAARNVIFGYYPKPKGAGFELERFDFLKARNADNATYFRPSDVMVGADGAIYVADWYDSGVGGHRMTDEAYSGTIYRITPKGKNLITPEMDLETIEGQISALKSPANNVRNLGFTRLKAQGDKAFGAVKSLLSDQSEYIQARAIWLLAQMGKVGIAEVEKIINESEDAQLRITSYRALRFVNHKLLEHAEKLSKDVSSAVRREVALSLRDKTWKEAGHIIYDLAIQYDGEDRWYLEAIGTAATGKEKDLYEKLLIDFAKGNSSIQWSLPMARLAWRLHPEQAVNAFKERALDNTITAKIRLEMLTAIGHIETKEAALAMVEIVEKGPADNKETAIWWLAERWSKYKALKKGLDKKPKLLSDKVDYLAGIDREPTTNPKIEEVIKLTGDVEAGKIKAALCYQCHSINDVGIEYGPTLTQWAAGRDTRAIAEALIKPSAGIAHGFDGTEFKMKSGNTIQGISLSGSGKAKLLVVKVFPGGQEVKINSKNLKTRKEMTNSLMLSAGQLGLSSQDVADISAYLKKIGVENTQ